ncbi:hypothetical protein GCM10010245_80240 [Streptomyces spectabilis]|nr:hypothetical protein GCM10010245_80240 [Streptomyces spectabilis]
MEREGADRPVPRGHSEEIAFADEAEPVVVRLGLWVSNTKSRRDKLTLEQRAALTELGVDWAKPVTIPQATPDSPTARTGTTRDGAPPWPRRRGSPVLALHDLGADSRAEAANHVLTAAGRAVSLACHVHPANGRLGEQGGGLPRDRVCSGRYSGLYIAERAA